MVGLVKGLAGGNAKEDRECPVVSTGRCEVEKVVAVRVNAGAELEVNG